MRETNSLSGNIHSMGISSDGKSAADALECARYFFTHRQG
jgi:hypothetical protein